MNPPAKILLIEDDGALAQGLDQVLTSEGFRVTWEKRGDTGLARARADDFDAVVSDLKMPGMNGLDLVRELHEAKPRLPIILMTAFGTTDTAIQATKFGAYDYLVKPFEMPEILELLHKAVASSRLMTEPVELGTVATAGDAIVGHSRIMQAIYKEIGRIAAKPIPVLIRGETGTGKELIARAIYQHSERRSAPFIAINCAAIPETLLESELFGHERGAFTGAHIQRIGTFERANHGTIFLDEIGDLTPNTQVKLLRVLQEKVVQRVGGKELIPVDVRVIAATHRNLEALIREKQFREDLYYRLSVVVIALPPLRDRPDDVPDLVNYFLHKYGPELGSPAPSIQPAAVQHLQTLPWPGNVRELENVLRKALLAARGYGIAREHVMSVLTCSELPGAAASQPLRGLAADLLAAAQRGELADAHARAIEAVERELLSQAIQLAQGNQAKAARWLGISRLTLRERLHHYGLHPRGDAADGDAPGDPLVRS